MHSINTTLSKFCMPIQEKSRNNWSISIHLGKIVIFVYKENLFEKDLIHQISKELLPHY